MRRERSHGGYDDRDACAVSKCSHHLDLRVSRDRLPVAAQSGHGTEIVKLLLAADARECCALTRDLVGYFPTRNTNHIVVRKPATHVQG